jgi:hypothetical protein
MTLEDLYKKITTPYLPLCYPFNYNDKDVDFLDYVQGVIQSYLKEVDKLDNGEIHKLNSAFEGLPQNHVPMKNFDFKRDVNAIAEIVSSSLSASFNSYHERAYTDLEKFFTADDFFYLRMLPQIRIQDEIFELYRMRKDNVDLSKGDGEMFHVPFDKRYLVSSQRYSIPGYPALYLAGSLFTSWCEMDKPLLTDIYFAKFRFKKFPIHFLDLSLATSMGANNMWELYSLFAMYPLIITCMVEQKHPKSSFKPEYLMPQMMMKIVRKFPNMLSGIVYISNKAPIAIDSRSLSNRNFVLCVNHTINRSGYDPDLASKMQMTGIKHITSKETSEAIKYESGIYTVDFKKVNIDDSSFHDIDVPEGK